jgi:ribosomal protein S18 acetylase RimI-like enzyme
MPIIVRRLEGMEARDAVPALAGILAACVRGGASVGFMNPFPDNEALAWWAGVVGDVEAGKVVLFGATLDGKLVGTAQLVPADKPNQPHRADVCKVQVHPDARNRGVGEALMRALEAEAVRRGLSLLTLDTASGAAERLYERCGYVRAGVIPDYALWPDGGFCDTTFYYKRLATDGPRPT